MRYVISSLCAVSMLFLSACQSLEPVAETSKPAKVLSADPLKSVIKVNVTQQAHNFYIPWRRMNISSSRGLGTLIGPNRILIPAQLVKNATDIELVRLQSGKKMPGKIVCVDYHANLALIEASDPEFIKDMVPLKGVTRLSIGDSLEAWQFDSDDNPVVTQGTLRKAELSYYGHSSLLAYQASVNLPSYASHDGMPVVKGSKLVGLMLKFNNDTRNMTLMSPDVIQHFLKDVADGDYQGFPKMGFRTTDLQDEQLRNFVALPEDKDGVYIPYVSPGGPADKAGLKKGDVLMAIDNFSINKKGKYEDPQYGLLPLAHITNTRSFVGDTRKLKVWRDKKELTLDVEMSIIPNEQYPISPFIYDRGGDFVLFGIDPKAPTASSRGGLIFQYLTHEYISMWRRNPPARFTYYNRKQFELFKPGEKIVVLNFLIHNPYLTGYEDFKYKVVKKLNGQPVKNLQDLINASEKPVDGKYHKFEFEHPPKLMILDATKLKAIGMSRISEQTKNP